MRIDGLGRVGNEVGLLTWRFELRIGVSDFFSGPL